MLDSNLTIPLGRAAKFGTLDVTLEKLPNVSRDHIFIYGLRQILNDAIAEKKDDEGADLPIEELRAKAQKRLDTLYSGELRARSESAEPVDPIEAEMYRVAKGALTRGAKETPEWKTVPKGTKDRVEWVIAKRAEARGETLTLADAIAKYIESRGPKFRRECERTVADAKAAAEGIF